MEEYIESKLQEIKEKESKLDRVAQNQQETKNYLQTLSAKLSRKEKELDEYIKRSVAEIIKEPFRDFFSQFKASFFSFFRREHQEEVFSVIQDMRIDSDTADRLFQYGFYRAGQYTVGEILEEARTEDIKEALYAAGAGYRQIGCEEIETVKNEMEKGADMEQIIQTVAEQASQKVVARRHR